MVSFGDRMRALRTAAGLSLRALARKIYINPAYASRIERGQQVPSRDVAVAIDTALCAGGQLVALLPPEDPMERAVRESERLARLFAADARPDTAGETAERLAVAYLREPAGPMLAEATAARRLVIESLRRIRRPATAVADLARAAGMMSGVLAYAALDLGNPAAAMAHAEAALAAADASGDARLRAWVRGTQSLIARFDQRYVDALRYAQDGLSSAPGPSRARLLCGVAQSAANLGDRAAAEAALLAAADAQERWPWPGAPGVLGFSSAKRSYYSASSLIWLDGEANARQAIEAAETAIDQWQRGDPLDRSLDDEALAHVYAATAAVQLDEVEQAAAWLEPIMSLSEDRRISWIRKRMLRAARMLAADRYRGNPLAADLRQRIVEYA